MGYGDGKDRHEQRAAIHGPGWLPLPNQRLPGRYMCTVDRSTPQHRPATEVRCIYTGNSGVLNCAPEATVSYLTTKGQRVTTYDPSWLQRVN